ncbi:hypothetical protein IFR04_015340 [Cadophora malorum]|uniref:Uncharacterized protein n=1 Tax=Cadophora malorum TaxID=108018 RepID=A0A8H7T1I6_9HELO|nr:hypothetical protein IFR04_015340 [Cadophora malorum]
MAAPDCAAGYSICSPPGATSTNTPTTGTLDFQHLFTNIIQSYLPSNKRSNDASSSSPELLSASASAPAFLCCNALLSCLLMSTTNIPFCYDRFTTNYFLPDGSYGTVVGGAYTSRNGDVANLETGEYTLIDGQRGNIYPSEVEKPDIATLPIPSQFTGPGIGSAVPASSLGREITVTYTTTLSGTTRLGTTLEPETAFPLVLETILLPTLVSGSTVAVTSISTLTVPVVIPGTTIAGTTIGGMATTVTTTEGARAAGGTMGRKIQAERMVPRGWALVLVGMVML